LSVPKPQQTHCLSGNCVFGLHILPEHNPGIKQDLPVLWTLVVDKLKTGLNESGCYMLGYADNTVILISRKHPNTVSELLKLAWSVV